MKGFVQLFTTLLIGLVSLQAQAFPEGRFECKNIDNLPNNVYEVTRLNIAGQDIPYVKIQRFFTSVMTPKGAPAETIQSQTEGFAVVAKSDIQSNRVSLLVAQMRLDFIDGELFSCKKP